LGDPTEVVAVVVVLHAAAQAEFAFIALTLMAVRQEEHLACKNCVSGYLSAAIRN